MYPISPNQAVLQFTQELGLALRHLLIYFAWAVVGALAAMGACYCCGYAAREAWSRVGPPERQPEIVPGQDAVDAVTREAELGIAQIEDYLWATCSNRADPPPDATP